MSDSIREIEANIAGCKERIRQIEAGTRGQVPVDSQHPDGGRARQAQLHSQRSSLAKFELEYVNAMLAEHRWTAADVIAAMSRPRFEVDDDTESSTASDSRPRISCDSQPGES